MPESPQEFRYRVTAFVEATLTLDARVLRFRQAMRQVQVPYANVRRFGVRARPKTFMGVVTSELLLLTEPQAGQMRLVRLTFDPDSENGRAALRALRTRLPDADTTQLPWPEAASRLGVPAHGWRDALSSRWGVIGVSLVAGSGGVAIMQVLTGPPMSAEERLGRGIVQLAAVVIGVVLVGIGWMRSK